MWVPSRHQTIARWLFVIGLQVPALFVLQSCKNDRPAPVDTQVRDQPQERAVFGSAPERASVGTREEASPTNAPPIPDSNIAQERARKMEPGGRISTPKPGPAEIGTRQRASVGDPGERQVDDGAASNRASREPAKRFLHYRPPGSAVGDTGELSSRSPEPQTSASIESIRGLIQRWADTLLAGDLDSHMNLYAPTLSLFNGSSNVSRDAAKAAKRRLISRLAGVRRFEMYDVRLRQSRQASVQAEFRIESDVMNRGVAGWYRLELQLVGGQWKIYSEEKLQPVSRRSGN